jgi:L-malate glycosyltransferase
MGIGPGPVAVSIGSIYLAKRPGYLVEAADTIRSLVPDFELIVIGDGPSRSLIDHAAAARPWIHAVGTLTGSDMVRHAALGSVMLNPGVVGLSVLDAFALGLPMVTCDIGGHGPEIEYLVDGENGSILPAQTSPPEFGQYVAHLLTDERARRRLQNGAVQAANTYTIENMVERFVQGISDALGRSR